MRGMITRVGAGLALCLALGASSRPPAQPIVDPEAMEAVTTAARTYAAEKARPPAEPETAKIKREIDDLTAQQSMASSAEAMVWLTWVQVGLGLAGFITAAAVFIYTREQVRIAQQSAKDVRSQLAAHISEFEFTIRNLAPHSAPYGCATLKNTGSTHAVNYRSWGDCGLVYSLEELPQDVSGDHPGPGSLLGVDVTSPLEFKLDELSRDEYLAVIRGKAFIFVIYRIAYNDIFGESYNHLVRSRTETDTLGHVRTVYY